MTAASYVTQLDLGCDCMTKEKATFICDNLILMIHTCVRWYGNSYKNSRILISMQTLLNGSH